MQTRANVYLFNAFSESIKAIKYFISCLTCVNQGVFRSGLLRLECTRDGATEPNDITACARHVPSDAQRCPTNPTENSRGKSVRNLGSEQVLDTLQRL